MPSFAGRIALDVPRPSGGPVSDIAYNIGCTGRQNYECHHINEPMGLTEKVAERMFGRPTGVLGKLGGVLMARTNAGAAQWVLTLLDVRPDDRVLEVGFGPGIGIQYAAEVTPDGFVAGIDCSDAMVNQARKRNAAALQTGRVELQRGSAVDLPYEDDAFDKAFSINSMQVWPDAGAGLRELHRVLKSGGTVALAFTPHARQPSDELVDMLTEAGFEEARLEEGESAVCALARG